MNAAISSGKWVRTTEATVLLGLSRTTLTKHRSNGLLKQGRHWITTGPFKTSPTLWNVDAVHETMHSWAEQAAGVAQSAKPATEAEASFNLLQLERFPNWYDHLPEVDRAIQQAQDDWTVRREYGWDGDDGGEWGPNPLQPGNDLLSQNWEDELALPFPEDFNEADRYVYELMTVIGKYKDDPTLMAHAIALSAANYLGNIGEPALGKIRGLLRGSPVLKGFDD